MGSILEFPKGKGKDESKETELVILGLLGLFIIGEFNNTDKFVLKNPRILYVSQQDGRTLLTILPILGEPKEILVQHTLFSYAPNMEISKLYIEHVTGTKITEIPPN